MPDDLLSQADARALAREKNEAGDHPDNMANVAHPVPKGSWGGTEQGWSVSLVSAPGAKSAWGKDENIYVGNGERSHRLNSSGTKTLCGIDVTKAAKQLASPGEPGCDRCFKATSAAK